MNRILTGVFAALILLLQYPLWLGKGGWMRVWDLDQKVTAQQGVNERLKRRNDGLDAEVRDLKNGLGAIEERARFELGMVKDDEVFFQILEEPAKASPGAASAPANAAGPAAPKAGGFAANPSAGGSTDTSPAAPPR
jgi:cell division protein FtsB